MGHPTLTPHDGIGLSADSRRRLTTPSEVRARVDTTLRGFLLNAACGFTGPPPLREMFGLLREFVLRGGKRLRPLVCYLGWWSAGGADCEEIFRAAASLEIFHAFTLIHDDIMDGSTVRRGKPSLHRALTGIHARNNWRGQADRFGVGVAILCGDLCLSYADELLYGCGLSARRVRAAQELVQRMRTEVMIGQSLDLLYQAAGSDLTGALDVVRLKAAKYTVERPLQIGAALAGAGPTLREAYSAFAIPVGEAFQLRDDMLGVFGDVEVTGKSTMDDLREGKPTALVAIARDNADPEQAAVLTELYGKTDLEAEEAATLRRVIVETGAARQVEDMISQRRSAAITALRRLPVGKPAKDALERLALTATRRSS